MGFEVLGALVIWVTVAVGLALYRRHFLQEARGDAHFEEWCKSHPRVIYVACRPGGVLQVRRALLERLAEANPLVATEGQFPWPLYSLELELERVGPDVLALAINGCRLTRGQKSHDEPLALIKSALSQEPALVEEIWLHGQLYSRSQRSKIDRKRVGWIGRFDGAHLELEAMVGIPAWAQAVARAA